MRCRGARIFPLTCIYIVTLAVGVTDDYGVHQDSFDSLDRQFSPSLLFYSSLTPL
jgi:hypothetical protein